MNLTRLAAVVKKEYRHIVRDPRSLISAILLPVCLMLAYCESLNLDVNNIPMTVIDYDNSRESRDFIERFTASGYFYVREYVNTNEEMQRSLDRGDSVIGVFIPRRFSKKLQNGQTAQVQMVMDGTDPTRGSTSSGYASMIAREFSLELLKSRMQKLGLSSAETGGITPQVRVWFNPALRSKNYIIPGLIALIMAILAALLTSTTISREWESNTMELLVSTPVSAGEILMGKFLPYFTIGLFDIIILILMGTLVYDVPIRGSLILLSVIIILFLSGVLFFGIALSAIIKSSLTANLVSLLVMFLPTMLLSGFIFFIPALPKALQLFSYFVPARYFITASRGIFAKASSLEILALDIFMLALFNLATVTMALRHMKKTLD